MRRHLWVRIAIVVGVLLGSLWYLYPPRKTINLGLVPSLRCPARLDQQTTARVQALALAAHRALGCADFSRTDVRLRADGTPFVLEINPLPGLSPFDSNFPIMTSAAGLSHAALIQRIVELAMVRYRRSPHAQSTRGLVEAETATRQEGNTITQPQESSASTRSLWAEALLEQGIKEEAR